MAAFTWMWKQLAEAVPFWRTALTEGAVVAFPKTLAVVAVVVAASRCMFASWATSISTASPRMVGWDSNVYKVGRV